MMMMIGCVCVLESCCGLRGGCRSLDELDGVVCVCVCRSLDELDGVCVCRSLDELDGVVCV